MTATHLEFRLAQHGTSPATGPEPDHERTDEAGWAPVVGAHVVDQIIEQMRTRIFAGLAPGDRIGTELELAEAFGVSRLAMRDAVRALRTLGLVEVRVGTGGGLWVAHSDPRHLGEALAVQIHQLGVDWTEMIEALTCIEPTLAGLAAERRTDEDLKLLHMLLDQHRAFAEDGPALGRSAGDFHIAISAAAGNRAVLVAVKALRLNLDHLGEPQVLRRHVADVIGGHEAILQAIEARDAALATKLMEAHDRELNRRTAATGRSRTSRRLARGA